MMSRCVVRWEVTEIDDTTCKGLCFLWMKRQGHLGLWSEWRNPRKHGGGPRVMVAGNPESGPPQGVSPLAGTRVLRRAGYRADKSVEQAAFHTGHIWFNEGYAVLERSQRMVPDSEMDRSSQQRPCSYCFGMCSEVPLVGCVYLTPMSERRKDGIRLQFKFWLFQLLQNYLSESVFPSIWGEVQLAWVFEWGSHKIIHG